MFKEIISRIYRPLRSAIADWAVFLYSIVLYWTICSHM